MACLCSLNFVAAGLEDAHFFAVSQQLDTNAIRLARSGIENCHVGLVNRHVLFNNATRNTFERIGLGVFFHHVDPIHQQVAFIFALRHSATLAKGTPGVLHGTRTFLLQTADGQITETHSISAGLDYPGVGPQHSHLKVTGRAQYVSATDAEALEGVKMLARSEGIIPALEPAHAIAYAAKLAKGMAPDQIVLVNMCGRGDKDMGTLSQVLGFDLGMEVAPPVAKA